MVKAIDIHSELAKRPMLRGRRPDTPGDQTAAAFATLAGFREGGIFAGSFQGDSAWERHPQGDELVQILSGAATLTVITEDGPQTLAMRAGTLAVVPRNCWHRFHAPEGVTLLTATPQPTDHSTAEDPRQEA